MFCGIGNLPTGMDFLNYPIKGKNIWKKNSSKNND